MTIKIHERHKWNIEKQQIDIEWPWKDIKGQEWDVKEQQIDIDNY